MLLSDFEKSQADKILSCYNQDSLEKSVFSEDQRKNLAKKDEALPDGSFPIRNKEDLEHAIKCIGLSKDEERAKNWIKKRAKDLDAEDVLPENWIQKSEGDKGGLVIGHTKSGKPIYKDSKHPAHKDFTSQDHLDAGEVHAEVYRKTKNYDHRDHQVHHLKQALKNDSFEKTNI